jgi:hypothetical protein
MAAGTVKTAKGTVTIIASATSIPSHSQGDGPKLILILIHHNHSSASKTIMKTARPRQIFWGIYKGPRQ